MKLDSKWFDHVRIKKSRKADEAPRVTRRCAHSGCTKPGIHRAPRGRNHEGQYIHFCLDHVREYNKSYNYFSGMRDDDIAQFVEDNATGHRPTWSMGNAERGAPSGRSAAQGRYSTDDPFELFREHGGYEAPRQRHVPPLERKALDKLGLEPGADKAEIRARYKLLVKRLHPDSNGGDRSSEHKLAEIIQAYRQLRNAGIC